MMKNPVFFFLMFIVSIFCNESLAAVSHTYPTNCMFDNPDYGAISCFIDGNPEFCFAGTKGQNSRSSHTSFAEKLHFTSLYNERTLMKQFERESSIVYIVTRPIQKHVRILLMNERNGRAIGVIDGMASHFHDVVKGFHGLGSFGQVCIDSVNG